LDVVFPNFHIDLLKSDFVFISSLLSQFSSDSTSASSTIATIGRGITFLRIVLISDVVEIVLQDDIASAKSPQEKPIEFRGEFEEFRCFQATVIKDNKVTFSFFS
jgi:hypothetical protein